MVSRNPRAGVFAVCGALERFETKTRTNWHYECAKALLSKLLVLLSNVVMVLLFRS
jgi:hypothetical protein